MIRKACLLDLGLDLYRLAALIVPSDVISRLLRICETQRFRSRMLDIIYYQIEQETLCQGSHWTPRAGHQLHAARRVEDKARYNTPRVHAPCLGLGLDEFCVLRPNGPERYHCPVVGIGAGQ